MLFNSLDFSLFLPLVFIIYWLAKRVSTSVQNLVLLISSYFFYACWNWKFLSLIILSTIVDFAIGVFLGKCHKVITRKLLLTFSIIVNLGILGFFKYFNFFIENLASFWSFFGEELSIETLNIVLPVGISFYTFQTLSYTIDVYNRRFLPQKNFIEFATFVAFFPQLVAGPIERAVNLLPQFSREKLFDYNLFKEGVRQFIWGLCKKIVIADNCGYCVDLVFNNHGDYGGSSYLVGTILFAFQIYSDFSGYSDMAIGVAKMFGIKLSVNFKTPYFSKNISEFWRRWHISLSSWFRDYVYIPLGGTSDRQAKTYLNILIVFLVSGLWHGANWTFIIWGGINAILLTLFMIFRELRMSCNHVGNSFTTLLSIALTFVSVCLGWIFFRAPTLSIAFDMLSSVFSRSILTAPQILNISGVKMTLFFVVVFCVVEWANRTQDFPFQVVNKQSIWKRLSFILYMTIVLVVMFIWRFNGEKEFIYFQF